MAAVVISHIGVPLTKEMIERPRPEGALVDVGGSSYPSGHATYAMLYPALAVMATVRLRPSWAQGAGLIVAGMLVGVAVGLSRVYLHVHYLSDVIGGAGLGVSAFAFCAVVALVVSHLRDNPARP